MPNGSASTMCGPTRPRVFSTHSATSSKTRGISGLGFEHQGEGYFDRVRDPLGALPISLADAEIQSFQPGSSLEFGAAGRGHELKINRHILGDSMQRQ